MNFYVKSFKRCNYVPDKLEDTLINFFLKEKNGIKQASMSIIYSLS